MRRPGGQRRVGCDRSQRVGQAVGAGQQELAWRAVCEQVHGLQLVVLRHRCAHLCPGVAAGVEHNEFYAFAQPDLPLGCVRNGRVDEYELARAGTRHGDATRGGRAGHSPFFGLPLTGQGQRVGARAVDAGGQVVDGRVDGGAVEHLALLQRHGPRAAARELAPRPGRGAVRRTGARRPGCVGCGHRLRASQRRLGWRRPLMPATSSGNRPSIAAATLTDWLTGSARAPMRVKRAG